MPTKVYLSSRNIIIDQVGQPILTIRVDRAKHTTLTPFASTDGKTPVPIYMQFDDIVLGGRRTELLTAVQDSTGATFATTYDLTAYLNTFFQRSGGATVYEDKGATSQYQEILILQNEALQAALDDINADASELNNIKELIEKSNKLLNKIYNPE